MVSKILFFSSQLFASYFLTLSPPQPFWVIIVISGFKNDFLSYISSQTPIFLSLPAHSSGIEAGLIFFSLPVPTRSPNISCFYRHLQTLFPTPSLFIIGLFS